MNTIPDLIAALEATGAKLRVSGEQVMVSCRPDRRLDIAPLVNELRTRKPEVLRVLRERSVGDTSHAETECGGDGYWRAANSALRRLHELEWPFAFLQEWQLAAPLLYERINRELPDEID